MSVPFIYKDDGEGPLKLLKHGSDRYSMNWVKEDSPWGVHICPSGLRSDWDRFLEDDEVFVESYVFENITEFPVYLKDTDIGIAVSLPDYYSDAWECMRSCCHTHIWCGGADSWICAYRMGGEAPHLGMVLTDGSLSGYSIIRDEKKRSNDRGSILLHPSPSIINPRQKLTVTMKWFWFTDRAEFERKKRSISPALSLKVDKAVCFIGEQVRLDAEWQDERETCTLPEVMEHDKEIQFEKSQRNNRYEWHANGFLPVMEIGEQSIHLYRKGRESVLRIWGSPDLDELVKNRCFFITEKQQETGGSLDGAYLIYDNESEKRYYSHLDDHNAGRERMAMGSLLALWLQGKDGSEAEMIRKSLDRHVRFVYRELLDSSTGNVFNDINRNQDWDRLYNYPWMGIFLLELYKLSKRIQYLEDAFHVLKAYYEKGGEFFYPIGLPSEEIIWELQKAGHDKEAAWLQEKLIRHADIILNNGTNFPKSEVNYEQSIVAPAADILLQAYACTRGELYLNSAEDMIGLLLLFNGEQPDYHMYENAIRHWDGFWFGKRRLYGDTFPHYWSVLTGVCLAKYTILTGKEKYRNRAQASLRGCLPLFDRTGRASCAFVYPETVNYTRAHYADPWANDQDWALYYAWRYREFTEGTAI